MQEAVIGKIAVSGTSYHYDKLYDYRIPFDLTAQVLPGMRVLIPFGKGNRKRQGVVMELARSSDFEKIKPIHSILDEQPVFSDEMLKLALWLCEHTFCTCFEALKAMMPAGINLRMVTHYQISPQYPADKLDSLSEPERNLVRTLLHSGARVERGRLLEIMNLPPDSDLPDRLCGAGFLSRSDEAVRRMGDREIRMVRLSFDPSDYEDGEAPGGIKLTPKQQSVVDLLCDLGGASVKELCYFLGVTPAVITALEKKGLVELYEEEIYRNPYADADVQDTSEIRLNEDQQAAFEKLLELYRQGTGAGALLYGVTGSGKTQVFLKLIEKVAAEGRGVIVMVPEISLTPQTLAIFHARFGKQVAVFHSALSVGQRMDEWKRVRRGEARIAIGTRSAVFAPFDDIGLIVMDEEQEHTYKSEAAPRFHARDVARFRAAHHKSLLLLASATPSVESFTAALSGRYTLCKLSGRYGNAILPQVQVVDMRQEMAEGGSGVLSASLREKIAETLSASQQIILLLNRRGHNTFVSCRSCGHVMTCPNCSISMTYHSANGRLMCHYCGQSEELVWKCSQCGGEHIRCSGYGTQRAEQELLAFFPEARILRMDADSAMTRQSYEDKLRRFAAGKYDIMLGTQMVAKGLNFPNVTLVGVLTTDQTMYADDFRSFERTFSLLTQVVGRSGRGDLPGTAIIQTMTPESAVIRLACEQDYEAFYQEEILTRKLMIFPPYCDFCMIGFVGAEHEQVKAVSQRFLEELKTLSAGEYKDQNLIVLGPASAGVPKVANKYRSKIIIKCRDSKIFREMISKVLRSAGRNPANKNVNVYADMNPNAIL